MLKKSHRNMFFCHFLFLFPHEIFLRLVGPSRLGTTTVHHMSARQKEDLNKPTFML